MSQDTPTTGAKPPQLRPITRSAAQAPARSAIHRKALVGLAVAADAGQHIGVRKLGRWLGVGNDAAAVDRILDELVYDGLLFVGWKRGPGRTNVYYHLHAGQLPPAGDLAEKYATVSEARRHRLARQAQRRAAA
jgi:hypothetical protein